LAVAAHAHLVHLRGHSGHSVFADESDRHAFLVALCGACERERVAVHAYALLPDAVWLLVTPSTAQGVGRAVQSVGRAFSVAFNRRHGRSGSVWDGRYRSTVIEPGEKVLQAMLFVDQAPGRTGLDSGQWTAAWSSSAAQHAGLGSQFALTDVTAYWQLGNTPFERAAAYGALCNEDLPGEAVTSLTTAVARGWPVGTQPFIESLKRLTPRAVERRPRGRPRKPNLTR